MPCFSAQLIVGRSRIILHVIVFCSCLSTPETCGALTVGRHSVSPAAKEA